MDDAPAPEAPECGICLDPIAVRGGIGCQHEFCFSCIQQWAAITNLCPMCKARFRSIERVVLLPLPASGGGGGAEVAAEAEADTVGASPSGAVTRSRAAAKLEAASPAPALAPAPRPAVATAVAVQDRDQLMVQDENAYWGGGASDGEDELSMNFSASTMDGMEAAEGMLSMLSMLRGQLTANASDTSGGLDVSGALGQNDSVAEERHRAERGAAASDRADVQVERIDEMMEMVNRATSERHASRRLQQLETLSEGGSEGEPGSGGAGNCGCGDGCDDSVLFGVGEGDESAFDMPLCGDASRIETASVCASPQIELSMMDASIMESSLTSEQPRSQELDMSAIEGCSHEQSFEGSCALSFGTRASLSPSALDVNSLSRASGARAN